MIDVIPTIVDKPPNERLSTNVNGTMQTTLEVMAAIRPRHALKQSMMDVMEPEASYTTKKHVAAR